MGCCASFFLPGGNEIAMFLPGLSNRIGVDSIQFSIERLQKPFDLISIPYRFNSKKDLIWYKTASTALKENWSSGKWPIFKRIVYYNDFRRFETVSTFCKFRSRDKTRKRFSFSNLVRAELIEKYCQRQKPTSHFVLLTFLFLYFPAWQILAKWRRRLFIGIASFAC